MADNPISSDPTLAAASIATGDLVPIVDISEPAAADKNKNTTFANLTTYFNTNLSFAATGHNHDSDYISIVTTPTTGNFPQLTAGGELVNSAYDETSFSLSGHTHTFASLTSKPTTLSGYGISDTKANFNTALSDGSFFFSGDTLAWSSVTSTPTTLSGYGISDTQVNFNSALSDGSFAFAGGAFHDGFSDFVANEHIDWVADYSATNTIHVNNYPEFTTSTRGAVGASGGGTTNYLRADGTWAAPPGGAASNSFETNTVTDTDVGYTWADTGSAVASTSTDTLTWVSGDGIDIDVDATNDAIRIATVPAVVQSNATETITGLWSFTNASGLKTNTITEFTAASGVTIDGVLLKDGLVDGVDVSAHNHDSDYISIVSTPTTGNFPQLTAGGELVNSTYDETSFETSGAVSTHESTYDHTKIYDWKAGTETGFHSIGIDDNATTLRLQLENTALQAGPSTSTTSYAITRRNNDGLLNIAGGSSSSSGGVIRLYGGAHSSQANDIQFYEGTTLALHHDASANEWDFQNNAIRTDNYIYTDFIGEHTAAYGVHIDGVIIKDFAVYPGNGVRCEDTLGSLELLGNDTNSNGANILLHGSGDLFGEYNDIDLRVGTTIVGQWDNSASTWDFQGNTLTAGHIISSTGFFGADADATEINDCAVILGAGRTGVNYGNCYVDLIGDSTYGSGNPGLRMIRYDDGPNSVSALLHNGTGVFDIQAKGAANIRVLTNSLERMRITSDGLLGIGTTTPEGPLHVAYPSGIGKPTFTRSSDVQGGSGLQLQRTRGTVTSPTAVANTDTIGAVNFSGYDGTSHELHASISCSVDGTVSTGTVPLGLNFFTGTTSAVKQMTITSAGNLGLGTDTPTNNANQTALTVEGTAYGRVDVWNATDNAEGTFYAGGGAVTLSTENTIASANVPLRFGNAGGEMARFDSNGRFGIGITNPSHAFVVANATTGAVQIGPGSQGYSRIYLPNTVDTTVANQWVGSHFSNVTIGAGGSEVARFESTGEVGLGTTSPSRLLHLYRSSLGSAGSPMLALEESRSGYWARMDFKETTNSTYLYQTSVNFSLVNVSNGYMRFHTNNTERVRILNDGNVGIGQTSPVEPLHVGGAIAFDELSADPASPSAEGTCKIWLSDGTGSGDVGDIMMKIRVGATTKVITLVDWSTF